ncbi:SDR family NAD(P)-dependent oxidoreductase [Salinarimonas sp.]|uniref:SDR family oxidoreductase n=1 Tax=Salinarimonas sp. TaxID=2766526 RepID=UPI0032D97922
MSTASTASATRDPAPAEPRRVVITGVSEGLGLALARAFAARGAVVAGCATDAARLRAVADALGPGHLVHVASVTDEDAMARFAEEACREGAPDLVVANAGVINPRRPVWEIETAQWRRVLDVNVLGVAITARAFLPAMIAAGSGLFVATSSGWGRSADWGLGPYCASKFAVEGIVDTLRHDLPEGVRAVALDPGGGINTRMLAECLPDEHDDYVSPERWGPGAAAYIATTLYAENASGSHTVPDQSAATHEETAA